MDASDPTLLIICVEHTLSFCNGAMGFFSDCAAEAFDEVDGVVS